MRDGAREIDGVTLVEEIDLVTKPDFEATAQHHSPFFALVCHRFGSHRGPNVVPTVDRLEHLGAIRREQRERDAGSGAGLPQSPARVRPYDAVVVGSRL